MTPEPDRFAASPYVRVGSGERATPPTTRARGAASDGGSSHASRGTATGDATRIWVDASTRAERVRAKGVRLARRVELDAVDELRDRGLTWAQIEEVTGRARQGWHRLRRDDRDAADD